VFAITTGRLNSVIARPGRENEHGTCGISCPCGAADEETSDPRHACDIAEAVAEQGHDAAITSRGQGLPQSLAAVPSQQGPLASAFEILRSLGAGSAQTSTPTSGVT